VCAVLSTQYQSGVSSDLACNLATRRQHAHEGVHYHWVLVLGWCQRVNYERVLIRCGLELDEKFDERRVEL